MAKEFTYRGKTIEELTKLSISEFSKLVPSRSRRSLTRFPNDKQKRLYQKVDLTFEGKYKKQIKTQCRDAIVIPKMIGMTIAIHNGKEYNPVTIKEEMMGHSLGEFALTRKSIKHSSPGVGATKSSSATKKI